MVYHKIMIYDITRTITPETKVWPGDTPYSIKPVLRLEDGNSVNLTTITFSAHTGTHADAYYHYAADGEHPAQMPLAAYIGPARVVSVSREEGPLTIEDFQPDTLENAQRLLIKSVVSNLDDDEWPEQIPYLSVALIDTLAARGVVLIGLDSPSVDAFDSTDLPCHHALRRNNMANLESLMLRDVPDGDYELIALPLKLNKACGSPVRAILREL